MDDENEFVESLRNPLPINHQFFQLMVAASAGFVVTKLTERGYEFLYFFLKNRRT